MLNIKVYSKASKGVPTRSMSHLQFVDGTLILAEGNEKNVLVLKSLIQCFELVSGFKVNWPKSHSGLSLSDWIVRSKFIGLL